MQGLGHGKRVGKPAQTAYAPLGVERQRPVYLQGDRGLQEERLKTGGLEAPCVTVVAASINR